MANRHSVQKRAKGGGVAPKTEGKREVYSGKGSNVEHEAEEKKSGGKVKGFKSGGRLDKKARGGSVKAGKVHEGADMKGSPWSAAHTGHGKNPASNPSAHLPKGVHGVKGH